MKMTLSDKVIYQACRHQWTTKDSYVAVPVSPRKTSIEVVKQRGLGLIRVHNGTVEVLVEPIGNRVQRDPSNEFWFKQTEGHRKKMLGFCRRSIEDGTGGLPTMLGDGPAIRCRALVVEYLKTHPTAKWKELFNNVPNHYVSHASMSGALGGKLFIQHVLKEQEIAASHIIHANQETIRKQDENGNATPRVEEP